MTTVTIMPSGTIVESAPGTTLLAAILAAGVALVTKCGGKAECGKCHVAVLEGRKSLTKTTREENAMLDTIVGVGSKSRLACQAVLGEEPVTVEILTV